MQLYDINLYGAVGDGITDCTQIIQAVICTCSKKGGGTVLVQDGIFCVGRIVMHSNVCLHVTESAKIIFIPNPEKYLPCVFSYFEGMPCMNYSALIYAYKADNICIEGHGIIDGQGFDSTWINMQKNCKSDKLLLNKWNQENRPVTQRTMGRGHHLRPNMIQFIECNNIVVKDITLINSPMWMLHPVLCDNVTITNVTIHNRVANGDGCDPEGCNHVRISNCYFHTRDDGIAIKAFRNQDGECIAQPCKDIFIENCIFCDDANARNGIALGSELTSGICDVTVKNCKMYNRLRGIYIKSNTLRGGFVQNIHFENIAFYGTKTNVIQISMQYGKETGENIPLFSNISFENILADSGEYALWVQGATPESIDNIQFSNCKFNNMQTDVFICEQSSNISFKNATINRVIMEAPK